MGTKASVGNFSRLPSSADAAPRGGSPRLDLTRYLSDYARWADISDRFWSKVDRRGAAECWLWKESQMKNGYGRFKLADGRSLPASRAAFALERRVDPGPMVVMHTCDNPACCNPGHLTLGTHADNMADMARKGRVKGARNPNSRLTDADVREIKRRIALGHKNTHIAADYGVTHAMISKIRRGKAWEDVA